MDLPSEYNVNSTFNISNLSLFDACGNSWMNSFEERGDDMIKTTPKDQAQAPTAPITRSKANKSKNAFNWLIQSIWS
jgi:hypothetical protein